MIFVLAVLLLSGAGFLVSSAAQAKSKPVLSNFRLKDVDGRELTLDSKELSGSRIAFCFVAPWSNLSEAFARQVIANQGSLDGKLVFLAQGDEREVRDMRERLDAASHIWLKPESKTATDFGVAFEGERKLDRVPALIVIDEKRSIVSSTRGEIGDADIKKALSARAN